VSVETPTWEGQPVRAYHDQPVLKEPIWTWEIPCYFFTGGLAGASAGLAELAGVRGNEVLARRAWAVATAGIVASPTLLISDLGRPARFLNMLRMLKVTSPMSVGSWIVSASGTFTTVAALHAWTGALPGIAKVARPAAALFGLPLSSYTAALIANTAVPAWHQARWPLPFLFVSGAALSAGAATAIATPPEYAAAARRLALGGAVCELAAGVVTEKAVGEHARAYKSGTARKLRLATRVAITAGAALLAGRGQDSRPASTGAGAILLAGALAARWHIFKAGVQSASDPAAVIGPQRAAIERGERRGAARR
jgi:Polysulphide reductase, NrfD